MPSLLLGCESCIQRLQVPLNFGPEVMWVELKPARRSSSISIRCNWETCYAAAASIACLRQRFAHCCGLFGETAFSVVHTFHAYTQGSAERGQVASQDWLLLLQQLAFSKELCHAVLFGSQHPLQMHQLGRQILNFYTSLSLLPFQLVRLGCGNPQSFDAFCHPLAFLVHRRGWLLNRNHGRCSGKRPTAVGCASASDCYVHM
mmetsp:Transcript_72503/g.172867  ORF Transcript_72503/g.172867 Transcript_72503/m.172867 type:complete len:203 (-) Transcript_72503:76-684(-)